MIPASVDSLGAIVLLAVVIAAVARNRGWNAALVLLGAGTVVGLLPLGPDAPPDPEFVLVLIVAPLVFAEALSSSAIDIRRVARPVAALAILLVLLTAAAVGALTAAMLPALPVASALCLGAVLAPTDAVAVAATAKAAGLPRRLVNVLEGESLLNDGTALTLLRVFAAAAATAALRPDQMAWLTLQSVLGGVAVGVAGGWALSAIAARVRDTTAVNGAVLVFPLPLFGAAELLGGSGILAVVLAALIFAHRTSSRTGYAGRLQSTTIWRTFGFVLQSTAFFLVGIEAPDELLGLGEDDRWRLAAFVPAVVMLLIAVRFAFTYVMTRPRLGWRGHPREWILIGWAGTRGPVSVLAAFTLPLSLADGSAFPDRSLMISATFCVVVVSLLLSPTIPLVARALALPPDDDAAVVRGVRVRLARAALNRLDDVAEAAERDSRPLPAPVLDELRASAEARVNRAARAAHKEVGRTAPMLGRRSIMIEMTRAEQEELLRLRDEDELPDAPMRTLQLELDTQLRAIRLMR